MFQQHLWRAGWARLALLLAGLWLFGSGEAMIVAAELGNSPWTVLAEGVAENTALDIGAATIVISLLVLAAWFPLRQAPGLGTVANAIVIGLAIGVTLPLLPTGPEAALAWPLLFGGIACVAIGGGIYLAARLGPGPRDGLMTGLHARTGHSLRLWRTVIEVSAMVAGFALGGTVGLGTAAFALMIGPGVQKALEIAAPRMRALR
jgi:uncharacterized membrane protein YczE